MKSKGLFGKKFLDIEVRESEIEPPDEDHVIVKVHACGVCGTDVNFVCDWEEEYMPLGHEIAAEVIQRVQTENFGALWNYSEMDEATFGHLRSRLRHFHVHDEVLEPGNENILRLAEQVKPIGFDGYVSIEVIKGENLPEDQLTETAKRLKDQITRVYGNA